MSVTPWFCELHRVTTTTDCPKCDDEQIAALEQYAKTPVCHVCKRSLRVGDSAWADDWKVLGTDGSFRMETRYTCDDCAGAA